MCHESTLIHQGHNASGHKNKRTTAPPLRYGLLATNTCNQAGTATAPRHLLEGQHEPDNYRTGHRDRVDTRAERQRPTLYGLVEQRRAGHGDSANRQNVPGGAYREIEDETTGAEMSEPRVWWMRRNRHGLMPMWVRMRLWWRNGRRTFTKDEAREMWGDF